MRVFLSIENHERSQRVPFVWTGFLGGTLDAWHADDWSSTFDKRSHFHLAHQRQVMPQHRLVERWSAWVEKYCRMWRNYERMLNTHLQFIHLALLVHLLKNKSEQAFRKSLGHVLLDLMGGCGPENIEQWHTGKTSLTHCTIRRQNSFMVYVLSLFAPIIPCHRVLRAWRDAVFPGPGVG